MSELSKIQVPVWVVSFFKMAAPCLVAIMVMWRDAKVNERDIAENREKIGKLEGNVATHGDLIQASAARIGIVETKQSIMDKSIGEALNRIESDLKDVKNDLKAVQRSVPK